MKKYLAILMLFSGFAMACPNLSGVYMCENYDDDGNMYLEETTISQSAKNNVTTYKMATENHEDSVIADNQTRVVDGSSITARCEGNSLKIDVDGADSGYTYESKMTVEKREGKLYSHSSFKIFENGNLVQEGEYDSACAAK